MPNSKCGKDLWFWLLALLATVAYAIWYAFKDDFMSLFFRLCSGLKYLFCTFRRCRQNGYQDEILSSKCKNVQTIRIVDSGKSFRASVVTTQRKETINIQAAGDVDKGYFGIVTYFVQMAAVMKIHIEFSDIDNSQAFLDTIVKYIDKGLNLELTQLSFNVCPVVGLTTLGKHL